MEKLKRHFLPRELFQRPMDTGTWLPRERGGMGPHKHRHFLRDLLRQPCSCPKQGLSLTSFWHEQAALPPQILGTEPVPCQVVQATPSSGASSSRVPNPWTAPAPECSGSPVGKRWARSREGTMPAVLGLQRIRRDSVKSRPSTFATTAG